MCAFKVLLNTLNISHGHKFTGWLGRRASAESFKLTSMSRTATTIVIKSAYSFTVVRQIKEVKLL